MANIDENLSHQQMINLMDSMLTDITNLRAAVTSLTAKLDTDFSAQNTAVTSSQLDVDYAAVVNPPALNTTT